MKVIIAGCRDYNPTHKTIHRAISESKFIIAEIVSGNAEGVDIAGERYAATMEIPCKVFPADWDKFGKAAGPIRNKQMAEYADALIVLWDGKSRGTQNMVNTAKVKGIPIYVYMISRI